MQLLRVANITTPTGNSFANSAAKTLFADIWNYPNNFDPTGTNQGRIFKIKGYGYVSSKLVAPGTLTFNIELNGTILGTCVLTLPVSLANAGFMIDAVAILAVTGTSGLINCQGFTILDNAGAAVTGGIVNTGTGTSAYKSYNTQTGGSMGISAQFSVADVGNIVTLSSLIIEEEK